MEPSKSDGALPQDLPNAPLGYSAEGSGVATRAVKGKEGFMKNLRSWVKTTAVVACGALFLNLIASDAEAGRRQSQFWPNGAKISTHVLYTYFYGTQMPYFEVRWPLANAADHYRITVYTYADKAYVLQSDVSPAAFSIDSIRGEAITTVTAFTRGTYLIVVTAYSGPDETVAYSESLQTSARSPGFQ
jgi:hypothetical protein